MPRRSRLTTPAEVGRWKAEIGAAMLEAQDRVAGPVGAALDAHGLTWDSPRGASAQLWPQAEWRRIVDSVVRPAAERVAADIFGTIRERVDVRGAWGGTADQRRLAAMLVDTAIDGGHRMASALSAGGLTAASNPPVVHPDARPTVGSAFQAAQKELNRLAENVASHMSNAAVTVLAQTATQYEPLIRNVWNCSFVPASRPDHMDADGDTVRAGQAFDVGGEQLMFPGDPDGSDEQTANCLCWLEIEELDVADLPADEPADTEEGVTASGMRPFGFNEDQPRDDHGRFGETDHEPSEGKVVGSPTPRGAHTHCQSCGHKFNSPRSSGKCNSSAACEKRQEQNRREGITPEQRAAQTGGKTPATPTPAPSPQVSPNVGNSGGHVIDRGPGEQLRPLVPPDSTKGFGQYAVNTSDGRQVQAWVAPSLGPRERPSEAHIQTMLSTLADLHEREPLPGGRVPSLRIAAGGTREATRGTIAFVSSTDSTVINLVGRNAEQFDPEAQRAGYMMPCCTKDNAARYIATHEYGHAHDFSRERNRSGLDSLVSRTGALRAIREEHQAGGLSLYGNSDPRGYEAYAETFAEYHMTGGTTDNFAAQFYASAFKWK